MYVKCNHVSRILDCDGDCISKLGYTTDPVNTKYFKDCMSKPDFIELLNMSIGDSKVKELRLKNMKKRTRKYTVDIKCIDSGKIDQNFKPVKAYIIKTI